MLRTCHEPFWPLKSYSAVIVVPSGETDCVSTTS